MAWTRAAWARSWPFGLAALAVAQGLWTVVHAASHLPFEDQWGFVFADLRPEGLTWNDFWSPHNEHRILIPRLLLWADIGVTRGRSDSVVALHWLLLVGFGLALARLSGLTGRAGWLFGALCLGMLLSGANVIPVTEPLTIAFTLVLVATVGAVHCAQWRSAPSIVSLPLALSCAMAATLTSAQGLAVWPLLILLSIVRGLGWRRVAIFAVGMIIAVAAYFWDYPRLEGEGGRLETLLLSPFAVLRFIGLFLAGPVGQVNAELGRAWGVALMIALGCLLRRFLGASRRGAPWPNGRVTLLALALFLVGCGLLAASARLGSTPRPPRYNTMAITFSLCVIGLWAGETAPAWRRLAPRTLTLFVTVVTVIATLAYVPRHSAEAMRRHDELERASAALRAGIGDAPALAAIGAIVPNPGDVWAAREKLIERRLTVFADDP